MKGTRGTRDFSRDALAYAKWLQRRSPARPASLAGLRLIVRAALAVALRGSSKVFLNTRLPAAQYSDLRQVASPVALAT